MDIGIIGSGYVGLVASACFAEMGNNVICVDIDVDKINALNNGIVPIYEPGLDSLIINNTSKKRLIFTNDIKEIFRKSLVVFIAVGTPMGDDGSADLQFVLNVAKSIGDNISQHTVVVNKSTVPIGTADTVRTTIQNSLDIRKSNLTFDVVSNPEFLKEGAAINDFMHPDRVVVGSNNKDSLNLMKQLYSPFTISSDRFIEMDIRSAEMTKYAANAMLATKISFINEISNICEKVGADVNYVRKGIGSDSRIGYKFIYPGCGYGGSCFPKDVKALINIAEKHDYSPNLVSAVENVNNEQKHILFTKVINEFGSNLNGKQFTIWGLSFKPETDDMREAPSIVLIKSLLEAGAKVNAYDPQAINESKFYLKGFNVNYFSNKYEALKKSDAIILVTEWKEFRSPDFQRMHDLMKGSVFIDGRNQFDKNYMKSEGFTYLQIGVK
jgi:UDPglucose 6-dehydrogenase